MTDDMVEAALRVVRAYDDRISRLKTALRIGMPADMAIAEDTRLSLAMDADRDILGDAYGEDP